VNLAPGDVIGEKYRVESELGRGGMGTVWLAQHLVLGVEVAIKVIDFGAATDESARRRFLQEAQTAASLRSAYVVQIFDYGMHEGMPFIVMERLTGETLRSRLQRDGVLSRETTAAIFTQIGRAMPKAHELGIVHRDLKPDNVFLVAGEEEISVKLLDFGVAKVSRTSGEAGQTTASGALVGTPHYMSPEQAHGGKRVDHRSDLWSLAIVAFQCLTGRLPFQAQGWGDLVAKICRDPLPVPSSVHEVPEGFDEWFSRATEREPDARFQTIREFTDELRRALLGDGAPVRMRSSLAPAVLATSAAGPDATTQHLLVPGMPIASEHRADELVMPADPRTLSSTTTPTSSVAVGRPARFARARTILAAGAVALLAAYLALGRSPGRNGPAAPPPAGVASIDPAATPTTSPAAPRAEPPARLPLTSSPAVSISPAPLASVNRGRAKAAASSRARRPEAEPSPSTATSALPPLRSSDVLLQRE